MSSRAPTRDELLAALGEVMRRYVARNVFFHHAVAERAGLNVTDLQCLNLLQLDGPMTAGQLAAACGLSTGGAITTVIDRLEKAGYARRTKDPADRRRVLVEARPEAVGRRIAPLYASVGNRWHDLLSGYDKKTLALLLDLFTRSEAVTHEEALRTRAGRQPYSAPADRSRGGRPPR